MSGQLPSALPLVNKGYSLEADMLTGWRPPNIKNPYPLYYDSDFDYPSSKTCVYSGYKPEDSFEFHSVFSVSEDSYPFDFSQPSITAYLRKKGKKPSQVEPSFSEDVLIFDSKFECGNLDHVEMINKNEYDLYMRLDTNTDGHMHWFYFSVSGLQGRRLVKFNIVNFTRNSNLFTNGMKPRVFSVQEVRNGQSAGWQPGGENVQFSFSKLNRHNLKKPFYQLSFSYLFQYANDKVWFATSIPYTYSRLQKIFRLLKGEKNSYITTSTLCKSLSLIDIPLITVTNPNIPSDYKKTIVAIGRIHPAETVGSWVMEGFLRFLASKHPEAVNLRNSFIFKIVPMLNPDGVIVGNCRTSLSGNDLNRTYIQPSEEDHPEIVSLKKLVEKLQEKGKVFMFFDMHGHFSKKGSFLYGPYFPIHHSMYYKSKIIPRLISERTEMFRFYSCKFRISKSKKRAARAVMSSEFQINHSYTLETSYHGYFSNSRETLPFTPESLFVLGEKLARSINEYSLMLDQSKSKLFKKQGKHFLKFPEDLPVFEEFDFEIPHLSFVSTTSNNKAPNDCFSNLAFRTEKHVKRNLDEWMNVIIK
jgi:predicted MPP superfamily phosphohydrolase